MFARDQLQSASRLLVLHPRRGALSFGLQLFLRASSTKPLLLASSLCSIAANSRIFSSPCSSCSSSFSSFFFFSSSSFSSSSSSSAAAKRKQRRPMDEGKKESYFDSRVRQLKAYKDSLQATHSLAWDAYPPHVPHTSTVEDLIIRHPNIEKGARLEGEQHVLSGRVGMKRDASKKLVFFDLHSLHGGIDEGLGGGLDGKLRLQIMCAKNRFPSGPGTSSTASSASISATALPAFELARLLRKGDFVSVSGFVGATNTGELTLVATDVQMLAPCLREIPEVLEDPLAKARNRHLDMLVNRQHMETFVARAKIIKTLRRRLEEQEGMLEVETPVLWTSHGGAAARPFNTESTALGAGTPLSLRIAPELFLKQLIVSGAGGVFEIGKVFRNEGIDATHNPEFTSCEFYKAFAGIDYLLDFSESIVREMALAANGTTVITVFAEDEEGEVTGEQVDLAEPFAR